MFSAKTYQKTVYLSFQCYFPCLGQNHWSLPAVLCGLLTNWSVILRRLKILGGVIFCLSLRQQILRKAFLARFFCKYIIYYSHCTSMSDQEEHVANCLKAIEDYRGQNISKWEAITQISTTIQSVTASTDNKQRSTAGDTYLAMLDEHD